MEKSGNFYKKEFCQVVRQENFRKREVEGIKWKWAWHVHYHITLTLKIFFTKLYQKKKVSAEHSLGKRAPQRRQPMLLRVSPSLPPAITCEASWTTCHIDVTRFLKRAKENASHMEILNSCHSLFTLSRWKSPQKRHLILDICFHWLPVFTPKYSPSFVHAKSLHVIITKMQYCGEARDLVWGLWGTCRRWQTLPWLFQTSLSPRMFNCNLYVQISKCPCIKDACVFSKILTLLVVANS